jgi:hypothetical protein
MVRLLILLPVVALLFAGSAAIPPVRGQAVPATFTDTFDGNPAAPEPFASPRWTVMVHERDSQVGPGIAPMQAHHGPDCSPPLATHPIDQRPQAAFTCNDHLMTALNDAAYGAVYLTPDHEVDFSAGEATIRWDVSTLRTSGRDWGDVWVTPREDALLMPLDGWLPSGYGLPRRGVHIRMDAFNGKSTFRVEVIRDGVAQQPQQAWWVVYDDWLTPSATRRDTFELRLGRAHLWFGMPAYGKKWFDVALADLGWDRGVVQWGHHSYTPTKGCTPVPGDVTQCHPNTWHWDNISISPAVPFAVVKAAAGDQAIVTDGSDVPLAAPAPPGATLRFHSQYAGQRVSFDGGATWVDAPPMWSSADKWPPQETFSAAVPAGATRVRFLPRSGSAGPWYVRDVTIWADAPAVPPC